MRELFELPLPQIKDIQVKRRNIDNPDISMLKSQQKDAFDDLMRFVQGDEFMAWLITAPAGSGKTYLVGKFVESYLSARKTAKIAVAAPTNKAVKVLYRQADYYHPNIDYVTVHKLLGLKEMTVENKQIFIQDWKNPPTIDEYDLVIIDEVSMLGTDLLNGVAEDNKRNRRPMKGLLNYMQEGVKMIFVGDKYQIPPVNSDDCPLFNKFVRQRHHIGYSEMTEIVRQAADNPIIQLATELRMDIKRGIKLRDRKDAYWEEDKGTYFINRADPVHKKYFYDLMAHLFPSQNFTYDADFAKVIAYRNDVVHKANRNIRRLLFGVHELRRIEPGEKLIALDPITEGENIIMPTNEEMEVEDFEPRDEVINDGQFTIPFYLTKVKYWRFDNSVQYKYIKVLGYKGQRMYDHILDLLAKHAQSFTKGSVPSKMAWGQYWEFKKQFANVGYNYGITGHRSQGSTYDNAVVMANDILNNHDHTTANRILYTSFTRPRHRLFIVY